MISRYVLETRSAESKNDVATQKWKIYNRSDSLSVLTKELSMAKDYHKHSKPSPDQCFRQFRIVLQAFAKDRSHMTLDEGWINIEVKLFVESRAEDHSS